MADTFVFDSRNLRKLSHDFLKADKAAYRAAQKVVKFAALAIKTDAAGNSSYSGPISSSGKVRMAGLNARITFGGNNAWWAVPIENSGKGNVEHPTFGHEPVTSKGSHPAFLRPAADKHEPLVADALGDAVEAATKVALDA